MTLHTWLNNALLLPPQVWQCSRQDRVGPSPSTNLCHSHCGVCYAFLIVLYGVVQGELGWWWWGVRGRSKEVCIVRSLLLLSPHSGPVPPMCHSAMWHSPTAIVCLPRPRYPTIHFKRGQRPGQWIQLQAMECHCLLLLDKQHQPQHRPCNQGVGLVSAESPIIRQHFWVLSSCIARRQPV